MTFEVVDDGEDGVSRWAAAADLAGDLGRSPHTALIM